MKITISSKGEIDVNPNNLIADIKRQVKEAFPGAFHDDSELMIDESRKLSQYYDDDPVCRQYKAEPGDMFIVHDHSSTRCRLVVTSKRDDKKKQNNKNGNFSPSNVMYRKAYEQVLRMFKLRGNTDQIDQIESVSMSNLEDLTLMGYMNSKKKLMYAFFTTEKLTNKGDFDSMIKDVYERVLADATQRLKISFPETPIEQIVTQYKSHADNAMINSLVEIIIVYNGEDNVPLKHKTQMKNMPFFQFFTAHEIMFNILDYRYQPEFKLLNPHLPEDRKSARDILSLNSMIFQDDKKLSHYKIKEGAKLIFI